jgi:hypothetical protein
MGLIFFVGCGGPSRVRPPKIDPQQAGQQAIAEYDRDGDGLLSLEELKACQGLERAISKYDADGDTKISASEIASRIQAWLDSRIGLVGCNFFVELDGKPLEGGNVELVPESFMGNAVKPAAGPISPSGSVNPSMTKEELPSGIEFGMAFGVYKVKITHPTQMIPPKYNEQTELGLEIGTDYDIYNPIRFKLKS